MDEEVADKKAEMQEIESQLDDQHKRVSSARAVEVKYDHEESAIKREIQTLKVCLLIVSAVILNKELSTSTILPCLPRHAVMDASVSVTALCDLPSRYLYLDCGLSKL
jgi:hypothetical protein